MTRDEAISLLTQVNKILVNSNSWLENTHEPLNMAFDMAISALQEQNLQQTCNNLATDTISRQAAIDIVRYECCELKGLAKRIIRQFNGLTPVQPEREYTMEEFMFGQDMGNPEDGSL